MRVGLIVNPNAGKGRGLRTWQQVRPYFEAKGDYEVRQTTGPADATRFARELATTCERIIALGGDGTLTEVINGLADTDVLFGIIPGGTGNDYARALGLPVDPLAAAALACEGSAQPVDLGKAEPGPYFLNIAGAGFDAAVADGTNRFPKFFGSTFPYLLSLLRNLFFYQSAPVTIELDGQVFERDIFLIAVGNGQYFGGGMKILPNALNNDGLFDLCLINRVSRLEVLRVLPRVFNGSHLTHPKVETFRGSQVTITPKGERLLCQADGELIAQLPITYKVLPGALRLVRPT